MKINPTIKKVLNVMLIVFGSILVAFGNIVFLEPYAINAGGLNGLGIIVAHFVDEGVKDLVYNIVVYILSIGLWVLGFFTLGKNFAFKTLASTIAFPIATTLFTMVPGTKDFAAGITNILSTVNEAGITTGTYLMASLFGGVFVGFGVGLTFLGGGSTGGIDVLTLLYVKLFNIKEAVASFINDIAVIVLGIIFLCAADAEKYLMPCLAGVLSIVITAVMIDIAYGTFATVYQCDIISKEWETLSAYAQDELLRGVTIIPVKGGYKHTDKMMIRVVLSKTQYDIFKSRIAEVDPTAFITVTETKIVFGEGFKTNKKRH